MQNKTQNENSKECKIFTKELRRRTYPFVSFGVRFLSNIEAMNMVESAGNLNRHRTVPIIITENGKYILKWFPALSGEAIAHAFQSHLADLSDKVCYFCKRHEFIKHAAMDFYEKLDNEQNGGITFDKWESDLIKNYKTMNEEEIEEEIVKNCVVEDICGFLLATAAQQSNEKAQGKMVRRTSAIQFSYVIPTLDCIETGASTTDVQMQVRMASDTQSFAERVEYNKPIQAPFNKEIASTPYSFIVNIDFDSIGYSSYTNKDLIKDLSNGKERRNRFRSVVQSLKLLLDGNFGAGKSRYHPFLEKEIVLVAVTRGSVLFTVSPPSMKFENFIEETIERAKYYVNEFADVSIKLFLWVNESKREQYESKINGILSKLGLQEKNVRIKENKEVPLKLIYSRVVGDIIKEIEAELLNESIPNLS
ncbi:MAG: DevR family CRISPR-associated autoregulator [Fervidicoccus fontis]